MRAFLDSSALTKAYVDEDGSERVENILRRFSEGERLYVSALVQVEVVSAFAKKYRRGLIDRPDRNEAYKGFVTDYPQSFNVVRPSKRVLAAGAQLAHRATEKQLKASDAIQMASVEYLVEHLLPDAGSVTFVCADKRLLRRARRRQLWTYNPETEPLDRFPDQQTLFS